MDRFEARKKIVGRSRSAGTARESRSHCEQRRALRTVWHRCRTAAFNAVVREIKPLAEPAIEAVEDGRTRFVPSNLAKTYFEWMHNIRDWCISRQLWWGHRIPAWYCTCGEVIVSRTDPTTCPEVQFRRSSTGSRRPRYMVQFAVWPFSTLGWPDKTDDLKAFYPGFRTRHRLRHYFLLGRADDDVRPEIHG